MSPLSRLLPAVSTVSMVPDRTSTILMRTLLSVNAIYFASGDQTGSQAIFDSPIEMIRGLSIPS